MQEIPIQDYYVME